MLWKNPTELRRTLGGWRGIAIKTRMLECRNQTEAILIQAMEFTRILFANPFFIETSEQQNANKAFWRAERFHCHCQSTWQNPHPFRFRSNRSDNGIMLIFFPTQNLNEDTRSRWVFVVWRSFSAVSINQEWVSLDDDTTPSDSLNTRFKTGS